jgi:DNA-binding IclR family transcriptional regulator
VASAAASRTPTLTPALSRPGGRGSSTEADSPALRLIALLEVIAGQQRLPTLQSLVEDTGLPKPTLHRMLQQLEAGGLVRRESDGRHYATGVRFRRLAETLLLNDTFHGARHRVLRALVDEVGESCNLTALVGSEVVYLDRVETAAPLRFYLHPGSRVPAHCSASGKMFLAQMAPEQRARLLAPAPLERCTPQSITTLKALEAELAAVQRQGYAVDREEFLPGLVCVAVPVPLAGEARSNLAVALQAPSMRLPLKRALAWLPALRRAAAALGRIEADALGAAARARA